MRNIAVRRHMVRALMREPYIRHIVNRIYRYTKRGVTFMWVQEWSKWWSGQITLPQFRNNLLAWEREHE